MILLLSGASETARALVVDNVLDTHKDWRHLALEDLREEDTWNNEEIGMEEVFGVMIACDCAKDVQQEGCHIIITCPSVYLIETVRDAFPEKIVTVHMGEEGEGEETFSHVLNPKTHSLNDTCNFLEELIAQ
ncbi:MAG TPA: hypothetical protein VJB10_03435 [Candidatus Peribacteraceae bacterium]|nr:hypothetical protein [Candidatus Peribacteraceae bacterium]